MKKLFLCAAAGVAALSANAAVAEDVNVAFFLEWATPNQIAKVEKAYDDAMGVNVNWTDFATGVGMSEAMLAGDIDISYSQGLAPFVTAIQQGAPLKMVAIAVAYPPNKCFVADGLGISSDNASELEGTTVAVPLNTMADYSFRKQMGHLGVDIDTMTIVDQAPADGAVSLADGSVSMACIFGGASAAAAGEVGTPIMSNADLAAAGISSFDVVSVTESFATENPELLKAFLEVTAESNAAWAANPGEGIEIIAADAGMDVEKTKGQMAEFVFPTVAEQLATYFNEGGIATQAAASLGLVFSSESDAAKLAATIDGSFLE